MPASTLIATAGAADANAYADVAFADQYHLNRPAVGTTWAVATTEQKTAALLWATLLLDSLWVWEGYTTSATQALMWPRQGISHRNGWIYLNHETIPLELKNATAEYARQLLVSDLAGNSDLETMGVTSMRAGPVAFTFKESVVAKPVPDTVVNLIPMWWGYLRTRATGVRPLQRA